MANEEHLQIIRRGVKVWNEWREDNRELRPDLKEADLRDTYLGEVYLERVDLADADLTAANLNGAYLASANLARVNLGWADLTGADLLGANFQDADLYDVNFTNANLKEANLRGVYLGGANLTGADLTNVDLTGAIIGWTTFGNLDISSIKGLSSVEHWGPSTIGIDTIYLSKGKIPETFLKDAGVPDIFITYIASLTTDAIEYYSCFISHSSKDQGFAERLYADLQAKGVRCWFAPEDLKIGDRFRERIEESIRVYDKLVVVLSENSVASEWVRREVEAAMEREDKQKQTVLFPVRLDNGVMNSDMSWAGEVRRSRHIGDFRRWKEHENYQEGFDRLLRDLKSEK